MEDVAVMAEKNTSKPQKKKLQTMILSLFLAAVVWFMVMSLTNPTITIKLSNLKVRFIGEETVKEKQLTLTGRDEIPALSVKVTGNRSDLMNYMDDIYVQVDVSDIDAVGEYTLAGKISIPTTKISAENENVSDIKLQAEELTTKEVDVEIKQTGSLKDKLVKTEARDKKVLISGAKSEIENVKGAVATIDISDAHDGPRRLSYLLVNDNGTLVTENETIESPRSEIEVMMAVYDAKTLPIEPVLGGEAERLYTLNREKTVITPAVVTVGTRNGANYDNVRLIIDKPAENNGEAEYLLAEETDMYIPPANTKARAKPVLESRDPAVPIENGENR